MSFVVTPAQHPLCKCNCNYHESYDFNTLRRQWSEFSKNFPYNKKMTGVFGLALFDACNENGQNYQCKCKDLYHQLTSDSCNGGKVCTCKLCADINNQKHLMASDTLCYTCPCGISSPNRLAYGCREVDCTTDGTKLSNKRDRDIKHLRHIDRDGHNSSEDRLKTPSVRRNSSPTKFCDGSISQVMGFKGNDLGTVYTKPMRSSIPTTPASSSSPTSLRGCLRDRRCSICGYSKCSPCSTCVPCSTCTSCNTCGYRPCTLCNPCGKCPGYHGNSCVPCQRLNIAEKIQKISEHTAESLAESVIEAIPEIEPVKSQDAPKHQETQKHHETSSDHHETQKHHETSSEHHETSEHSDTKHKIIANPVNKIINNPTNKTSYKTNSKSSDKHSNTSEKISTDNEISNRHSVSSVKSVDLISSKSEQDSTHSKHHHHQCTCKCMRTLCSLFTFLIVLASIFLMWSYMQKTWPFKPKCSYRYHLYAPIKPYKR